ncbi:cupin-like domain-containing protein [Spartinivicinus poritis]|uniref:Cupin-like domain-containing protein n=1 Tax=Spartinivicinus poritis TaxID=2994640 RepID=A0ABT5U7N0_9GAMM|nr:cupin-like domain-containing protein [Spartinivicinus sp. A2-2]MDE1462001.1 cupin-like domain-containing protein [Spartinivicinus sp. A2-2]
MLRVSDLNIKGCKLEPVDSVNTISASTFNRDYIAQNRPLLIKGGVAHWDALPLWNNEYLNRNAGHNVVDIETSRDQFEGRLFDDAEKVWMPFSRFLERLTLPSGETDYFVGSWLFPTLAADVPDISAFKAFNMAIKRRMIMSRGGNRIALHYDWYQNMLCQVAGYKRLVLIDIVDTPFLYPLSSPVNYSPVNVQDVNWSTYPEFCNATIFQADIEPGDVLYMPMLWWHAVESIDRNIMISQSFYDTDRDLLFILKKMLALGRLNLAEKQMNDVWAVLESDLNDNEKIRAVRRQANNQSLGDVKRIFAHRQLIFKK